MSNWREADTSYIEKYKDINFRERPDLYRIGKGEQGVLATEPYRSEILAIGWRFKTPEIAEKSSSDILTQFYWYLMEDDFVGADISVKYLRMGWSRSRRYANHKSGQKYDASMNVLPQEADAMTSEKAQAAQIFRRRYLEALNNPQYLALKKEHRRKYES